MNPVPVTGMTSGPALLARSHHTPRLLKTRRGGVFPRPGFRRPGPAFQALDAQRFDPRLTARRFAPKALQSNSAAASRVVSPHF